MATMDWNTQGGSAPSAYQDFLVPAMFDPFAPVVAERAGVAPGMRVLDVACGTGALSRELARRAGSEGSVTGVDFGEPMLEVARAAAAGPGAAPITYLQGDAAALPVADHAFDAALCQQGLQFFPDRLAALRELRRALEPGGSVAVATWDAVERTPFGPVAAALARHVSPETGEEMRSPFVLHDPARLRALLEDAGFSGVEVTRETLECTWSSHADFAPRTIAAGPIAAAYAAVPEGIRAAIRDEAAAALAPHALPDGRLRMPLTAVVATGRA
jgi:ubiquinone/menaquinone biosynthesis C-methylase UbiE